MGSWGPFLEILLVILSWIVTEGKDRRKVDMVGKGDQPRHNEVAGKAEGRNCINTSKTSQSTSGQSQEFKRWHLVGS